MSVKDVDFGVINVVLELGLFDGVIILFGLILELFVNVVESVCNVVNFLIESLWEVVGKMFFFVDNWMDFFGGGVIELVVFVIIFICVFLVVWFLFLKMLCKLYFYVEVGFIV